MTIAAPEISLLIARAEAATGPDRVLDCDIRLTVLGDRPYGCLSVGHRPVGVAYLSGYVATYRDVLAADDVIEDDVVPRYTASLDAAATLVPEGCGWIAGWGQTRIDEPMGGACISRNGRFIGPSANYDVIAGADAPTPALALVVAALRAIAASSEVNAAATALAREASS